MEVAKAASPRRCLLGLLGVGTGRAGGGEAQEQGLGVHGCQCAESGGEKGAPALLTAVHDGGLGAKQIFLCRREAVVQPGVHSCTPPLLPAGDVAGGRMGEGGRWRVAHPAARAAAGC